MLTRIQEELPGLLTLAHDRSDAARSELARKMADLFLAPDVVLTPHEEQMVNELIDDLLKTSSPVVRNELIMHFAENTHMPRAIAVNLARGPIETASAVLMACESLDDNDLIDIIETNTTDYACAVAGRRAISEAVADALVTTGDINVMQIVAENMGAQLSAKAVDVLVDAARMARDLQRPLFQRPELTQEAATRLYWWCAKELRRAAMDRFHIPAGQLDAALGKAIDEKLDEHLLDRNDEAVMYGVADWLNERQATNFTLLPKLLRLGHFRLFDIILSRMANLDLSLVDVIVYAPGGRYLAALCRAIGVDKANFVSIFLLSRSARPDEHVVHPRELSEALYAFDNLDIDMAKNMVHTWRANPAYLAQIQPDPTPPAEVLA